MNPRPVWKTNKGQWYLDLRPTYGQYWARLPAPPDGYDAAYQWAWQRAESLRIDHRARTPRLPGVDPSRSLGSIIDAVATQKRCASVEGKSWWQKYADCVKRDLGAQAIGEFAPPAGNVLVGDYRDTLRARGLGPKTTANYLCVLWQILKWATRHGYLSARPDKPSPCDDGESIYTPVYQWIDEPTFRKLRAAIFSGPHVRSRMEGKVNALYRRTGKWPFPHYVDVDDLIERRRLWLSAAFYCGYHRADLQKMTSDWFFPDARMYRIHNSKNAKHVCDSHVEMPAAFLEDVRTELKRLGRPWHPGELVGGGDWGTSSSKTLHRACLEVGCIPVSPSVLRRSFVRELVLRKYSKSEIITLMGHTCDSNMVDTVYSETPVGLTVETRWKGPVAPERKGPAISLDAARRARKVEAEQ